MWYTMAEPTWANYISFFSGALSLFSDTVNAMLSFPSLAIGLAAGVMAVVFGLAYQFAHASKR